MSNLEIGIAFFVFWFSLLLVLDFESILTKFDAETLSHDDYVVVTSEVKSIASTSLSPINSGNSSIISTSTNIRCSLSSNSYRISRACSSSCMTSSIDFAATSASHWKLLL